MVDSGASLHVMSKSNLTPEEQEAILKSKDPSVIMSAHGTSHTTEEATVSAFDLDMFVQVQVSRVPCKTNPDHRADRSSIGKRFGDVITANHKILNELCKTWRLKDLELSCKNKSAQETQRSLGKFSRPEE